MQTVQKVTQYVNLAEGPIDFSRFAIQLGTIDSDGGQLPSEMSVSFRVTDYEVFGKYMKIVVITDTDPSLVDLMDYRFYPRFVVPNGHGSGMDLILYDDEPGEIMLDGFYAVEREE